MAPEPLEPAAAPGPEPEPGPSEDDLGVAPGESLALVVPPQAASERLDRFLASRLRDCSRSYVQKLIKAGLVLLGGAPAKASKSVSGGERLEIEFPPVDEEPAAVPEDIPVPVLFEDEAMVVVVKPAGMPTHPSCGHARGTLANAMVFHCNGRISGLNGPVRPGIVHRLDMDTSGVILVAKTDQAHRELAREFAAREVAKTYLAIVHGALRPPAGVIDRDLGRHPVKRKKQAVLREGGRAAITEYRTLEQLSVASGRLAAAPRAQGPKPKALFSLVELRPKTGRTHQIRVHLASSGCPILCDGLYGRETEFPTAFATCQLAVGSGSESRKPKIESPTPEPGTRNPEPLLRRQALHATAIEFTHPLSGQRLSFSAPPPADFATALELLRRGGG
ncbi:MAG TPA: RluA family pseudouridine synthase [Planctomycetota bacterium]|nr:RluA family pseudouridine synthase [Planctomycetota bacterium]